MKSTTIFKVITILIMLLIFWFSHQDGIESLKQSNFILRYVKDILKLVGIDIRKIAHFSIYMLLGISSYLASEREDKVGILRVLLFVILYACSDEFHQSFVPGRGPSLKDVIIDTFGGTVGIFLIYNFQKITKSQIKI